MFDFEYYHRHTEHFIHKNLHAIPSFRYIRSCLQIKHREKVLDAGCGTGYLLHYIMDEKGKGYGIDISHDAIGLAKRSFPQHSFRQGSLTKLPYPSNYFDKIYCFNVIEHIADQKKAMQELRRVLKPNGTIVLGTNDKHSLSWKLFCLFYGGDSTHIHEFTASEFIEYTRHYFKVTGWKKSSCIGRYHPLINSIFHTLLKGDILVCAKKTNNHP